MTPLRAGLPPLPVRMRELPVDQRGYPVPWFVATIDGVPDFRVIRPSGVAIAIKRNTCWLCGQPLGKFLSFAIGPMCSIDRITSEPPSHRDCVEFAVKACPFLTRPGMARSPRQMPDGSVQPACIHIDRNPGVTALWTTRNFKRVRVDRVGAHEGFLIQLGPPESVTWWREGRLATREEVQASIDSGFPALREAALKDGPDA